MVTANPVRQEGSLTGDGTLLPSRQESEYERFLTTHPEATHLHDHRVLSSSVFTVFSAAKEHGRLCMETRVGELLHRHQPQADTLGSEHGSDGIPVSCST